MQLGNRGTAGVAEPLPPAHLFLPCGVGSTAAQLVSSWCPLDRDCAECGAFGTGPLATNCSIACADANVTLVLDPIPDDGWCKERTLDNQLFFFLVEEEARGRVILRVRAQESKWAEMLRTCQREPRKFDGWGFRTLGLGR